MTDQNNHKNQPHQDSHSASANNDQTEGVSAQVSQDGYPAPNETMHEEHTDSKSKIGSFFSSFGVFILAPIIAVLLTAFVFQSYQVDGPSMENTLQNRDRLIVYKLPRTIARITGKYMPSRYDIVIFNRSNTATDGGGKQLIKRVIGLPGDRVVVKNGRVTIYNEQYPDGFNPDEGKEYSQSFSSTSGNVDINVHEGQVFVMGDNRANSLDSRAIGAIQAKDIVGQLVARIYPINKVEGF